MREFLAEIGVRWDLKELDLRVTYQDACHLGNAQRIKEQPRNILRRVPGLRFAEMTEASLCCGSAGIYNLVQPEMSRSLLDRKISNLKDMEVDYLTAGNPGCLLQIEKGIKKLGLGIKTAHPVEILDWSYRGIRAK